MSKYYTTIEGRPPSFEVRRTLKDEDRPVLVAFSLGKDAICATHALLDDGIDVRLAYLYLVPGLDFVQRTVESLEDHFGMEIRQYPHPSIFRWLTRKTMISPGQADILDSCDLVAPDYGLVWDLIKEDFGLPADTWVADGARANDSQQRRMSLQRHGVMKEGSRKVSPIWDWSIAAIRDCMAHKNVPVPVDYEWFGRSFDGLDRRFLGPLKEHAPEDFDRVLEFFPMADLDLVRHEL